ncbi:MAG: glycosyltransferase family 4 protein [Candidatus Pacebacteria bacterium]|nr:glycosyltransferase family 4 protein [Candidatus Paceibacterota bacterium]
MRILTFGWEFPPVNVGGLGKACQGLTAELMMQGAEVVFVLPRTQSVDSSMRFIFADIGSQHPAKLYEIDSPLRPYQHAQSLLEVVTPDGRRVRLSRTVIEEVHRYAAKAADIAKQETFDLIHAHDWVSYLAGIAAKRVSGKKLILHVHATSYDQAASDCVDSDICAIEYAAFREADCIVTVSQFTKNVIVDKHNVDPEKVEVVHNGNEVHAPPQHEPTLVAHRLEGKKIILYHGRITVQKGVDYFVRAARRVVDTNPNVLFVISGYGDMKPQIMHLVGELGLSNHVLFAGELWGVERDRLYQSVDLLVMPSVSEPFGLVPLEAIQHGTPVLISKQSGVSEVLAHALKVDFWDIEEMANKMLAVVTYGVLNQQLVSESQKELQTLSWRRAADKVMTLYRRLLAWVTLRR